MFFKKEKNKDEEILEEFLRVVGVLLQIDSDIKYSVDILKYNKKDITRVVKEKMKEIKILYGENSKEYYSFDGGLMFLEDNFIEDNYDKIALNNLEKLKEFGGKIIDIKINIKREALKKNMTNKY